ncbi:MAG: DNA cytosine methyltransferase [Frankia sp.]|nr:DNA cytosine methyltransferase [Frankia sp.]
MSLTALDLFCGAGGSSTGLAAAGVRVVLAANHWQLAVDVHQANHPQTDHDCADISAVDPRRYPPTDLLWASPECTNHSVAKGVRRPTGQLDLFDTNRPDPAAERSRATMWDVVRFAETALMRGRPYRAIIVENVVDAARWMFWPAWRAALEAAGYTLRTVFLNSAFAHGKDYQGAPQYRDRLYVVAWRRGATPPDLDIRPPGWCPTCERPVEAVQAWKRPWQPWGRYRAQYTYLCPACRGEVEPFALPAAVAIDWSDVGEVIGARRRPLTQATRERIRAGLARYGRPILAPAGGTWNESATPVDAPMRTRTTRETEGIACPPPVAPASGGAEPFLAMLRRHVRPTPIRQPAGTVAAAGNHHGLVTPPGALLVPYYGTGVARPVDRPAGTVTTRDRHALVTRPVTAVTDDEVDACRFRMLRPAEVLAAMAFPRHYLMRGTKTDQVRMAGNAVTPPAARLLAERVLTALESS